MTSSPPGREPRRGEPAARGNAGETTSLEGLLGPAKGPETEASLEPEQGREKVQQFEARMPRETLESTGWNRAAAAKKLGMAVRTLAYRLRVLGVKKPE